MHTSACRALAQAGSPLLALVPAPHRAQEWSLEANVLEHLSYKPISLGKADQNLQLHASSMCTAAPACWLKDSGSPRNDWLLPTSLRGWRAAPPRVTREWGCGDRRDKVTPWTSVHWALQLFPPQKCMVGVVWHISALQCSPKLQLLMRASGSKGWCHLRVSQTADMG